MKVLEVIVTMTVLYILLLIGAAICFVLSALNVRVGSPERSYNLVSAGLFLWVLVPLIQMFARV